jgi:hypothetical protein
MLPQGAIANASQEISLDEFLAFLADELPEAVLFKFQPESGKVYASVPRWRAVLSDAAAVVTIANGLWQAYDRFIKPIHESNPLSKAAILVDIKTHSGEYTHFNIGGDVKDKNIFISSFEASINSLNLNSTSTGSSREIQDIEYSGNWIQIK